MFRESWAFLNIVILQFNKSQIKRKFITNIKDQIMEPKNCFSEPPKSGKMKFQHSSGLRNERGPPSSYFQMMLKGQKQAHMIDKLKPDSTLIQKEYSKQERLAVMRDQQKPDQPMAGANFQKVDGPYELRFSKFTPETTNSYHIFLIIIVAFIACALIGLTYWFTFSSASCMKQYQRLECWKQEKDKQEDCRYYELCMADEQSTDYMEFVLTLGAACILIFKKYQREVIRLIWDRKGTKIP